MTTALTILGTESASSTLSTAGQFQTATGGTSTSVSTKIAKNTQYIEMFAEGTTTTQTGQSSIPSPTGNGWLWDVTTLEGQTMSAGLWTPTINVLGSTTLTATPTLRFYVYNSGTFTLLGSVTGASKSITTSSSALSFTAPSLAAHTFATGDKLYVDLWMDITVAATSTTATMKVTESSSSTAGTASQMQIVTPGYGGTLALVQSAAATNPSVVSTISASFSTASTAGNLLVAIVATNHNSGSPQLTAPTGFTQGELLETTISGSDYMAGAIYYRANAPATTTITVGAPAFENDGAIVIAEFSGVATATPFDAGATASLLSASSGTVSATLGAGDLAIAAVCTDDTTTSVTTNTFSASGWTPTNTATLSSECAVAMYHQIGTASGTATFAPSWTGGATNAILVLSGFTTTYLNSGESFVGESDGAGSATASLSAGTFGGESDGVSSASAHLTDWIVGSSAGVGAASATLTAGASGALTQLVTSTSTGVLDYAPIRRTEVLCDGTLLVSYYDGTTSTKLVTVANPKSSSPTITAVSQSFSITGSVNNVGSLYVSNNGTTTSDVWVVYCDQGSGSTNINVAHGTYTASGGSWSWDNTGTNVSTTGGGFSFGCIVWNGTDLIICIRYNNGSAYEVGLWWTATKNGSTGWSAVAQMSSTTSGSSHYFPILLHDATLGVTICVYSIQADTIMGRILADTQTTAALANWTAETAISGTFSGVGAANLTAILDPQNARLFVGWCSSAASPNPNINVCTYTTTALSVGTAFTVTGGSGTAAVSPKIALDGANPPTAYVFWASAALGAASDISYVPLASPYASGNLGSIVNYTNASSLDNNAPHVPSVAQSGQILLTYVRSATSPYPVELDSRILVSSGGTPEAISGTMSGVGTASASLTTASLSFVGSALGVSAASVAVTHSVPLVVEADGIGLAGATLTSVPTGTGIATLAVTTQSQSWSGGPSGSPGTETDITSTDSVGNGWSVGIIPTYGGALISSWYDVALGTAGANQTNLGTSTPDGKIHWLEQSGSGTYAGSEDKPFTLVEQAPTGTAFRRYYKGTFGPDANGFNWAVYACIYPGDPGFIAYRLDCINPSGSSITLGGSDGLEIAMIGGMQQADSTWAYTNGKYATVGGTATTWPTASGTGNLVSADPDYVYINPANGGATTLSQFTVKQKLVTSFSPAWSNPQLAVLVNSNREKIKLQGDISSFPGSTTSTAYLLTGFARSLTSTIADAIAADYLNPGTPSTTTGSFTSFSYDERAFVFAASSNALSATLDLSPTHVTTRFKPIYKITGWTATSAPALTWGGTALTSGTDYQYAIDATNSILYIQLYADVVASGAGSGQRNNAALAVTFVTWSGTSAGVSSGSLSTLTVTHPFVTQSSGVSAATLALTNSVPLVVEADGASLAGVALTHSVPFAGSATGASVATATLSGGAFFVGESDGASTANLILTHSVPLVAASDGTSAAIVATSDWIAGEVTATSVGVASLTHSVPLILESDGVSVASATLSHSVPLAVEAGGVGVASLSLTHSLSLFGESDGVSSTSLSLTHSVPLAGESDGVSSGVAALTSGRGVSGTAAGVSAGSVALPIPHSFIVESYATSVSTATAIVSHPLIAESDGLAVASVNLAHSVPLVGESDGSGTASATVVTSKSFSGLSNGIGSASASLVSNNFAVSGEAAGVASAFATLTHSVPLRSASSGVATVLAILALPHLIVGTTAGASQASAGLTVARGVGGTSDGGASASTVLSLPHLLVTESDGVANGVLDLTITPSQVVIIVPTSVTQFVNTLTGGTVTVADASSTQFVNTLTGGTTLVADASSTSLTGPPLGATALS